MTGFDWSRHQTAAELEAYRSFRFREEWRPLLLQYMGVAPGMRLLEVGCGPGTFAPFLAAGIAPGRVVGLDLDARFIDRARAKAAEAGIANVEYVVGDAYALPFPDDSFDGVTSYTGTGVLTDPERAIREMIRVCRPGGTVALMEAFNLQELDGLESAVDAELYPGAGEYRTLWSRLARIDLRHLTGIGQLGSSRWPVRTFPGLMSLLGLEGIRLNSFSYVQAPDDANHSEAERRAIRQAAWQRALDQLALLRAEPFGPCLAEHGFTTADLDRLAVLTETRFRWLAENPLWDFQAGFSVVMAGRKPRR